jgi:RNA polymerase sigma-B factor
MVATVHPSGPDAVARCYATTGDRGVRDTLVTLCEPLVRGVARDYGNPGLRDDLVQVGFVGLLNAIERFDPGRGTPFVRYARPYIRGEIAHFLRDHHSTVRRPRWLEQVAARLDRAADRHLDAHGRHPGLRDLAAALGLREATVTAILQTRQAVRTLAWEDADGQDVVPTPAAPPWQPGVEDRATLLEALRTLPPLQRTVVFRIFFLDDTQMVTACRLGVSQKHVSRVLAAALRRLRHVAPLREVRGLAPSSG